MPDISSFIDAKHHKLEELNKVSNQLETTYNNLKNLLDTNISSLPPEKIKDIKQTLKNLQGNRQILKSIIKETESDTPENIKRIKDNRDRVMIAKGFEKINFTTCLLVATGGLTAVSVGALPLWAAAASSGIGLAGVATPILVDSVVNTIKPEVSKSRDMLNQVISLVETSELKYKKIAEQIDSKNNMKKSEPIPNIIFSKLNTVYQKISLSEQDNNNNKNNPEEPSKNKNKL